MSTTIAGHPAIAVHHLGLLAGLALAWTGVMPSTAVARRGWRLAVGSWMLLFAALGIALRRPGASRAASQGHPCRQGGGHAGASIA